MLRLPRDARPQGGVLAGRIDHVTSGESCEFTSSEELLAWLERRAAEQPCPKDTP